MKGLNFRVGKGSKKSTLRRGRQLLLTSWLFN